MKKIVASVIILSLISLIFFLVMYFSSLDRAVPKETKKIRPSAFQLAEAKANYEKLNASYLNCFDERTKETEHVFALRESITDADLKNLPDLPFHFCLVIHSEHVTDKG